MKDISKREMPLLNRTEIVYEYDTEKTPKKEDIRKLVSAALKISEDLIVVKHVYQKYGENKVRIIANAYKDKESLDKIEHIKKKRKKEKKKAEKPKEKLKEEVKEKKPKEEPKE